MLGFIHLEKPKLETACPVNGGLWFVAARSNITNSINPDYDIFLLNGKNGIKGLDKLKLFAPAITNTCFMFDSEYEAYVASNDFYIRHAEIFPYYNEMFRSIPPCDGDTRAAGTSKSIQSEPMDF